jgi:hypothetical protein
VFSGGTWTSDGNVSLPRPPSTVSGNGLSCVGTHFCLAWNGTSLSIQHG